MTAGEYQVVIVKYGTRSTMRSDVYLNHHLYHEPDGPIEMDYFFWVVRNSSRTVVVDTGFSAAGGENRRRTSLIAPADAFAQLGIDTTAQLPLIVTHAHYDHIGNLDLFTAADIYINEREPEFWNSPHAHHTLFHHAVEDVELENLARADAQGRVHRFADRVTVAPGIEVLRVGGHTPGQSVVKVNTSEGVVLLASDAMHYNEELERAMPFVFATDLVDMYKGFDLIKTMRAAGEVQHIVPGHDPDTLAHYKPLPGPLEGLAATIGEIAA